MFTCFHLLIAYLCSFLLLRKMDTKKHYKPIHLLLIFLSILILHKSLAFGAGDHKKVLCINEEREALLEFKQGVIDDNNLLSSWGNEQHKQECCSWRGVQCSNSTGHIQVLNLRGTVLFSTPVGIQLFILSGNISSSLVKLQYLKYLDLSSNGFEGQIPKFIGYFKRLEYLNLSTPLTGPIPTQFQNLTSLKVLDLPDFLTVKSLDWLSHLVNLEYLDLSWSKVLAKNWLQVIVKLPNLRELYLSRSELHIIAPSSLVSANFSSSPLAILDLSNTNIRSPLATYSWLFNFTSLTSLDLSGNFLTQIDSGFGYMKSLEHLKISFNDLQGRIPKSFENLGNLRSLDVSLNNLSQPFPEVLSILSGSMTSLEFLSFQRNALTGSLINLTRFSSLKGLWLQYNSLNGTFHESLRRNSSLVYLNLCSNQMTGQLPDLELFPSLVELNVSYNRFHGKIPQGLGQLSDLKILDVSFNGLQGLPETLGQLSKLKILDVSFNKLQGLPESFGTLFDLESFLASSNLLKGTISESHLSNLCKLKDLDLSSTFLTWNVSLGWVPCFQLHVISLSSCSLGPHFPNWLQNQKTYSILDISRANISDTLPSWFSELPPTLTLLNLSHNQISGKIPDMSPNNFFPMVIDFGYNKFSGPLPRFPQMVTGLYLSSNHFSGSLNSICKLDDATILDLSENLFSGEIPECSTPRPMPVLTVLNVANNSLSGSIPYSLCSSTSLSSLYVRNNRLSGQFPASLKNCLSLKVLDLGRNKLSGNIPEWMGTALPGLGILSLGFNEFSGSIPSSICWLQFIQILDLSGNHFSGRIPQCFSNFTTMQLLKDGSSVDYVTDPVDRRLGIIYHDNAFLQWKRKSIDLSRNKLVGEIPRDFSRMNALLSLNLSKNHLTGNIINGIGTMKKLEVLDLSRNQLSGKIPIGLANLTFLSVLDLSNNNLSGRIPSSPQLQGFDPSAYGGNIQLCGPPLPECPT